MTTTNITKYIAKHYGGKDTLVQYVGNTWRVPKHSTINCPFETVAEHEIFMQWASPSHYGMKPAIFWGYVKRS